MKLITRDTDYALRALCFIAGCKQEIVPVSELVRALQIPRPFLRKILQVLNKKRILKSHRGKGGGFILGVVPKELFLVDLITIFQGPLKLNECVFKKRPCPRKAICRLKKKIDRLEKYVLSELGAINLADLLKEKSSRSTRKNAMVAVYASLTARKALCR
jgi:Rrf2 family protein